MTDYRQILYEHFTKYGHIGVVRDDNGDGEVSLTRLIHLLQDFYGAEYPASQIVMERITPQNIREQVEKFMYPTVRDEHGRRRFWPAVALWMAGAEYIDVAVATEPRKMQRAGWTCVGGVKGERRRVWRKKFPFPLNVLEMSLV